MKKVIFTMAVMALSIAMYAQGSAGPRPVNQANHEKHAHHARQWMAEKHAQRKEFIIGKMDLTETEKAAFEVAYTEYTAQVEKSKAKLRKLEHQMNDSLTDEQYLKTLDLINAEKMEQAKAEDAFYNKMKTLLPARKIYLYYRADKGFNRFLLKDMNKKTQKKEK
ncbi:MAG: hypothetical protein MJZ93_03205 [Paludibacteraceae bacterium]|nr:hypothetical protein [Paludibacteraceae bacterium]